MLNLYVIFCFLTPVTTRKPMPILILPSARVLLLKLYNSDGEHTFLPVSLLVSCLVIKHVM